MKINLLKKRDVEGENLRMGIEVVPEEEGREKSEIADLNMILLKVEFKPSEPYDVTIVPGFDSTPPT